MIKLVKQFLRYRITQRKISPFLIICTAIRIVGKLSYILHLQFIYHFSYVRNFCYDISLASYTPFVLELCTKPR
jgi:hypothetical protein